VRDNGAAMPWRSTCRCCNIYGVEPPTSCSGRHLTSGWAVGHSYPVYAPLLLGCTHSECRGKAVGTPMPRWRAVIEEHGVRVFFMRRAFRADSARPRRLP